jgi:peptidyl-prolyl cis-trans isomerase B (cyclophilin B)
MKNTYFISIFLCLFVINNNIFAQKKKKISKYDTLVTISTQFGEMKIILYEKTPKHRQNFLKLAKEGFYNNLLFHRVIKNFMIQGGDSDSRNAVAGVPLGMGNSNPKYKIDAEFFPDLFHKKGALAAARDGNPAKASSSCQFYIVQGKKYTKEELERTKGRSNATYTPEQEKIYETLGGTPFLDQNYTVYGEVIQGIEVIDKIADVPTNPSLGDRPEKDVQMQVSIKKMSKKKITKLFGYQYPQN